MADAEATAPDAPASETAPPADPPTPPANPTPPATEGTLTMAEANDLRANVNAWEERVRVHEAAEADLQKQLDDLKAGHTSATDQSAKAYDDLLMENGKLREMLSKHTGGRINLDSEIRFVNADGVKVEEQDGKRVLVGEFSYRPIGSATNPGTQPSREERAAQANLSGAGSLPTTKHVVPGVNPNLPVV